MPATTSRGEDLGGLLGRPHLEEEASLLDGSDLRHTRRIERVGLSQAPVPGGPLPATRVPGAPVGETAVARHGA